MYNILPTLPAQQAVNGEFSHPVINIGDRRVAEERMALNLYGDRFGEPDRDVHTALELSEPDSIRARMNLEAALANYKGFGVLCR